MKYIFEGKILKINALIFFVSLLELVLTLANSGVVLAGNNSNEEHLRLDLIHQLYTQKCLNLNSNWTYKDTIDSLKIIQVYHIENNGLDDYLQFQKDSVSIFADWEVLNIINMNRDDELNIEIGASNDPLCKNTKCIFIDSSKDDLNKTRVELLELKLPELNFIHAIASHMPQVYDKSVTRIVSKNFPWRDLSESETSATLKNTLGF